MLDETLSSKINNDSLEDFTDVTFAPADQQLSALICVRFQTYIKTAPAYCCALSESDMEKTSLPYSTKTIPVPPDDTYLQTLIRRGKKFIHNCRWKAFFYLNPDKKPQQKQTFGFKSTSPAPHVMELKNFENNFVSLIASIKFDRKQNHFQTQLKKDVRLIKSEKRAHIKADKSNNYYKMESKDYKALVEKEIQKEYRKATTEEVSKIEDEHKEIVSNLELEDRVFTTTEQQCFATLKDHKLNFRESPIVRLINPCKPEIGKIAKRLLENVNNVIRKKTELNQWRSTSDVTTWFNRLKRKETLTFIQFDVVNFYPTIHETLLKDSINFARQFLNIGPEDERIILCAKKSLLFNDNSPWVKKGNSDFDVTMGSYDGAETCELVGLFLLSKISQIDRVNSGLYRDDGLLVTPVPPSQAALIKKKICAIFGEHGLKITAEANRKTVDFLDVTFNLESGTYSPYTKPNNTPWIKIRKCQFDVTLGSIDGAVTCELVGLFLLSKISEIDRVNSGLYRDDGLLVTPVPPRQPE